jgi:hypothetical protein
MSDANQSAGARAREELDQLMQYRRSLSDPRRDRAARYGRLALKIAKAGGMAFAGLAGMAMGSTIGRPEIGVHALHHAGVEVAHIIADPWD